MKVLAVDPGDARIGIAISDETANLARPLCILRHISRPENARRIAELAIQNECASIVIGTPLDSAGGIGPRARASLKLASALREITQLPIICWDESGSSIRADALMLQLGVGKKKRAESKDDRAAAIILQDYLDSHEEKNDTNT